MVEYAMEWILGRDHGRVRYGAVRDSSACFFAWLWTARYKILYMAFNVYGIVITGSNEACRKFHVALVTKFPTTNLGELAWSTVRHGC